MRHHDQRKRWIADQGFVQETAEDSTLGWELHVGAAEEVDETP